MLIELTQGDFGDPILLQCRNPDGTPITPFPGGNTVAFRMRETTTGHIVTGVGAVTGANNDELAYTTVHGDTAVAGRYEARFVVTYPGGAVHSFPASEPAPEALFVEVSPGA